MKKDQNLGLWILAAAAALVAVLIGFDQMQQGKEAAREAAGSPAAVRDEAAAVPEPEDAPPASEETETKASDNVASSKRLAM